MLLTSVPHFMSMASFVTWRNYSAQKSLIDNLRLCWHYWHFKRITQHRFKRYFGQTTRVCCIEIIRRLTLHSFFVILSPKTQRISFHNHNVRLNWLRVTPGYSPNSKDHSEDTVLTRLNRYKPNRRRRWRQFRKSNLKSVSTFGRNVGISALYREGITLKGIKLIWINK